MMRYIGKTLLCKQIICHGITIFCFPTSLLLQENVETELLEKMFQLTLNIPVNLQFLITY